MSAMSEVPHGPDQSHDSAKAAPLTGVHVVEAGTYVSAPFAAMVLAQLGARVTKIEPPDGDPARRFGYRHKGVSVMWINVNHGKVTLAADLKTEAGRQLLADTLASADVFIQNWRPGVSDRLQMNDARLREVNPRLIHLAITGFGTDGPYAATPSFDSLIQAVSGLADAEAFDLPSPVRSYIADKVTAMAAAQAVLAALFERERTGLGTYLEMSMLGVMAHFNFADLAQQHTFLDRTDPIEANPRRRSCCLRTADGFIALAPVTWSQVTRTITAVGRPEWADELRALPVVDLAAELFDRLETETPHRPTSDWLALFSEADVPASPVPTFRGHFDDPQVRYAGTYEEIETALGRARRPRYPLLIDGAPLSGVASAPLVIPSTTPRELG
jgi:crotonobetainyl-CoA:carnitine CoA-transferase CaiB-like acyl-CoA transferase